ncbi:MAG: rhomboid family intramembrane serine protease [bacterium]|nr:rhomboid family intramembrane serine protease [bacterium]
MPPDSDAKDSHVEVPASEGGARIELSDGGALVLGAEGVRRVDFDGTGGTIHAYEAIGHVYASERVLLIGTADDLITLRQRDLVSADPRAERDRLFEAIRARPGGEVILASIAAVERLGDHEGPAWVIWATVLLCVIGAGLQIADRLFDQVGIFVPELVVRGEYWRAITMHFLHDVTATPDFLRPLLPMLRGLPIHMAFNMAGMLVLGHLVERPLGGWRTAIVLAFAGFGTIAGIFVFGHGRVLGASGLVSGLAGAMLALELHYAFWMPTYWRIPRRIFIGLLLFQFAVVDQLLAHLVAGGAHLGGFAGGYVATWLLGRPGEAELRPTASTRVGAVSAAILAVMGFVGAWPLARHDLPALERHALRVADLPFDYYRPGYDNAAAWLISISGEASPESLDLAVALAERAVGDTAGLNPSVLDTLAEALFQRGDLEASLFTIDAAIALAPNEPYFREQRRRFTGERDPGDRPPEPGEPLPRRFDPVDTSGAAIPENPSAAPPDARAPGPA